MTVTPLATGAELRMRGARDGLTVLAIDGGTARDVPGTWSASVEYVVRAAARARPELRFAEVRYRVRSWKRLESCIADGEAALDAIAAAGAREVAILGYSMGGAVATAIASHPLVGRVIGLAPWLPEQLDMSGMAGKRLDVFHGALDRYLPGIPGVSPDSSRAGFDRLRRIGVAGTYTLIPGAVHAIALRAPVGAGLIPMPRARRWAAHVIATLPPTR